MQVDKKIYVKTYTNSIVQLLSWIVFADIESQKCKVQNVTI